MRKPRIQDRDASPLIVGDITGAVDGFAVLLVVVVAQPADDVDVRALAQVLGGVLGLLAPQGPLDRGGFLLAAVALTRLARRVLLMAVSTPLAILPSRPLTNSSLMAPARCA